MGLSQKYKKSLTEQWCMRFKTLHPEKDSYDGVIIYIGTDFVALREESDFEFDGIQILPKKSIKGFRDNKFDCCCNDILEQNEQKKKLKDIAWLKACESYKDVIKALHDRDIWPGVETVLDKKNYASSFYLGPIVEIEKKRFGIRCYDAAGKWEEVYEIAFSDLFRIEFDSKYCNNFNAYMRRSK